MEAPGLMEAFDICDIDINECESDPCQNGGTCANTDGSFTACVHLATQGTFARLTSMSVRAIHVRMEAPAPTLMEASLVHVQLATQEMFVWMMLMNA